jgi:hypothetical protein
LACGESAEATADTTSRQVTMVHETRAKRLGCIQDVLSLLSRP